MAGLPREYGARIESWTSYWSGGSLHCLPGSLPDDYAGNVAAFWLAAFATLPPSGGRMLDIGTGNGALPLMARPVLVQHDATLDAIDLSAICPRWHAPQDHPEHARIRFHPATGAEQLPFADKSFDLAASQFGFEYTCHERSIPELARVLKPAAGIFLIMHHADSRLTRVARRERGAIDHLLAEGGLLDCARQVYPCFARVAAGQANTLAGDPQADLARTRFNRAAGALRAESQPAHAVAEAALAFVADDITAIALGRLALPAAIDRLERYRQDLLRARLRSDELVDAAQDGDAVERLADRLGTHGFSRSRLEPIQHAGHLLGWCAAFHRPHRD